MAQRAVIGQQRVSGGSVAIERRSYEATVTNKFRRRQCVRKHDPEISTELQRLPSLIYRLFVCDPALDRIGDAAQLPCLSSLGTAGFRYRLIYSFQRAMLNVGQSHPFSCNLVQSASCIALNGECTFQIGLARLKCSGF